MLKDRRSFTNSGRSRVRRTMTHPRNDGVVVHEVCPRNSLQRIARAQSISRSRAHRLSHLHKSRAVAVARLTRMPTGRHAANWLDGKAVHGSTARAGLPKTLQGAA